MLATAAQAGRLSQRGQETLYSFIERGSNSQRNRLYEASGLAERQFLAEDFGADPAVQKLGELIASAKPVTQANVQALARERARRVAVSAAMRGKAGLSPTEAARAARGAQKGEIARVHFDPPATQLTPDELDILHGHINAAPIQEYEKITAGSVLDRLYEGNLDVVPSELNLMGRLFGDDFLQAIVTQKDLQPISLGENVSAIVNVSRVLQTSQDMSAVGRQGRFFIVGRPKEAIEAGKRMAGVTFSEDAALALDRELALHPLRKLADEAGLYLPNVSGRLGPFSRQEEVYLNNMLGGIVKPSQRAYQGYLAVDRMEVFETLITGLMKRGLDTEPNLKLIADFVNAGTGRGRLGPLSKYGDVLGTLLYAPRLNTSRPDLLITLGEALIGPRGEGARRYLAWQMGKDWATYVGSQVVPLTLLKTAGLAGRGGGVSIEWDPRSTDFGKVRLGNTRLDFWGGAQPWVRASVQLATGEKKLTTGEVVTADRLNTAYRFFRSKLAPTPGWGLDQFLGETMVGESRRTGEGIISGIAGLFTPLFIQGMLEGFGVWPESEPAGRPAAGSVAAGLMSSLSFIGVGTQTYPPSMSEQLTRKMQALQAGNPEMAEMIKDPTTGQPIQFWSQADSYKKEQLRRADPSIAQVEQIAVSDWGKVSQAKLFDLSEAEKKLKQTTDAGNYKETIANIGAKYAEQYAALEAKAGADRQGSPWQEKMKGFWAQLEGITDPEQRDFTFEQFERSLSPAEKQRWDAIMATSGNPTYELYKKARAYISDNYWDQRANEYKRLAAGAPINSALAQYPTYQALNDAVAQRDATAIAVKNRLSSALSDMMAVRRIKDERLDAILYIWGYTDSVKTKHAQALVVEWMKIQGWQPKGPPRISGR